MTTYKKPATINRSHLRYHHDYEIETGINKRISCLVAVTVVALIMALAALSIAIMLVLQVFSIIDTPGTSNIDALQQRVQQLENQARFNSSMHTAIHQKPVSVDEKLPVKDETNLFNLVKTPTPATNDKPNSRQLPPTPDETILVPNEEEPNEEELANSDEIHKILPFPGTDDDEDHEGSGHNCPIYPRPTCPQSHGICETKDPCPKFECCKK